MGVRVVLIALVLALAAGCTGGDSGERVATGSTSSTAGSSVAPTSSSTTPTSTSAGSVATSTTGSTTMRVALPPVGCELEAVEYVAPDPAPEPWRAASGPFELRSVGPNWVRAGGRTWVGNDEESAAGWVGPIDDGDAPAMLVSRDPGCETRRVIGGSVSRR